MHSWKEFRRGKKYKADVAEFSCDLIHNLSVLRQQLLSGTYRHSGYQYFRIVDPKPRDIHKASVRDRVVHHLLYRALYPYFERRFIFDSYSCRIGKGTHRALRRFARMIRTEGRNNTRTVWALSCDVKKCFASITHEVLKDLLAVHIVDRRLMAVISEVIDSFPRGIPLGNLTSQLFVNVYLDMLDHHLKETLGARHYLRYADDLIILSHDRAWLQELLPRIDCFVTERLRLQLHPRKVSLRTTASGVDFLGWVHFPDHRVLRTTTKRRMLMALRGEVSTNTRASYLGLLGHGNAWKLRNVLESGHGFI